MSTFSASSLFAGVNSSLMNSYSLLSCLYSDSGGLTQDNLTKALTNTSVLTSSGGSTFASYLVANFSSLDKNKDGTLSAAEVQTLMSQISSRGLTQSQVASLGAMSGVSADTQATILDHFTEIDTNGDGYVTSSEVQGYILQSKIENQKIKDQNKMINRMSLYYGDDSADDNSTSLLSYKWLQDDTSSSS